MAKSIAKSCPLCLNVDDPAGMLPVMMTHSTPPQSAPMYLCRLCVIQIMKSTLQSDVVDPTEVFGDVKAGASSSPGSGSDLGDRSGIPPLGDDQANQATAGAAHVTGPDDQSPGESDTTINDKG